MIGANRSRGIVFSGALIAVFATFGDSVASAQVTVDPGAAGASAGASVGAGASVAPAANGASTGAAAQPTVTSTFFPGGVAPPPPGQALGGGNVGGSSSSRPKSGDETDGFDLGPNRAGARGNGGAAMRGDASGPVFTSGPRSSTLKGLAVPSTHTVKKRDTLWRICEQYFKNPYQWPRIWAMNPQIKNPHYIEVGEVVRLKLGTSEPDSIRSTAGGNLVDRRRQVGPGTIFLREQAFFDEDKQEVFGEVYASPEDKMFLTDTDQVYVKVKKDDVVIGQELTVFRPIEPDIRGGATKNIVRIQGTLKVNQWNEKTKVARASVIETLDTIERGALVALIPRHFEVVPPKKADVNLKAKVVSSINHNVFYGQNQLVFVDKGSEDGLVPGNRLFIGRRADVWRDSFVSDNAGTRVAIESQQPAKVERLAPAPSRDEFPEEVIGELRVIGTKKHSSICLVTRSEREIEIGDVGIARQDF
ncbi:MAG: LysM peptidoglycan-binding domain-containing protein [Polyangiaceae bacterium]